MTLVLTNGFPCPSPVPWASLRNTVIRVLVTSWVARASQKAILCQQMDARKSAIGSEASLG